MILRMLSRFFPRRQHPKLPLPTALQHLLDAGRWPRTKEEALHQNLQPLVPFERIQQLAPEEGSLYLLPPPFQTVAECAASNPFWLRPECAPAEIDLERALDIGDFGLGSDAPLILDYRANPAEPRVLRLRWSERGTDNHWVEAAPSFDAFARILGLLPIA
jgi:hypothetical protein